MTGRLLLALVLGCMVATASPAQAARCSGRYLLGDPLVPGGPDGVDVIEVGRRSVSIASGCPAVRARTRGRRRFTKVVAKWKNLCAGIPGKATLEARIDATCGALAGRFVAKRAGIFTEIAAPQSVCGDGVVDPALGEQCDGASCAGGVSRAPGPAPAGAAAR